LETWDSLFDPVECLLAAGLSPPPQISREQAVRIIEIGDELERLNYPDNLGGLLGGNMMTHVLELMRTASLLNRTAVPLVNSFPCVWFL